MRGGGLSEAMELEMGGSIKVVSKVQRLGLCVGGQVVRMEGG